MKIGCECGYTIRDHNDNLPYKGYILKDQDFYSFIECLSADVSSYIDALRQGKELEWMAMRQAFAPKDTPLIMNLLPRLLRQFLVAIYECENCGRLYIETSTHGTRLARYVPEPNDVNHILASENAVNKP